MRISCMRLELDNRVGALPCDDRWQSAGDGRVADVKAAGEDVVTGRRLYQLVCQAGPVADDSFEIRFLDPGVQPYAFTFGR